MAAILPADARRKKVDAPAVKYVFYMIGDGMGINEAIATQQYNAATGYGPAVINFTQFPVRNFITTHSGNSLVTDSAAAGSALATGVKTYNDAISVDLDRQPTSTVAEWAKAAGYGTGVATTVGVNHATPACFYAHATRRGNYDEIAAQYVQSQVDFAAGGGFITQRGIDHDSAYYEEEARKAGVSVFHGPSFAGVEAVPGRVLCLSGKEESDVPYAIDRTDGDTSLSDFVDAGIRYLDARFGDKGFFFMVEGGKIDYGGHGNDAAACFQELTDFANAIDIVLAFCAKHPDESLVVVTADHETGGLQLGSGSYEMHPERMAGQKVSVGTLTSRFRTAFFPPQPQEGNVPEWTPPTWEQVQDFFRENLGLWDTVAVDERAETALKATYERTFGAGGDRENNVANLYSVNTRLVSEAVIYLNRTSGFQWSHGSHTGSPVGLYVQGKCADAFQGVKDNAEIAPLIATLAGYKR